MHKQTFHLVKTALLLGLLTASLWLPTTTPVLADALSDFPPLTQVPQGSTVRIDGSGNMETLNQILKQRYEQEYPGATVEVDVSDTEAAINELVKGEIDLAAIGRRLTDAEKAKGLVEIPLSEERIAVIVGKNNPFKGNLTVEQFIKILRGEITDWSEVGGTAGAIRVIDRPLNSDTRVALSRYGIFQPAGLVVGENATQLETDDTAAVIKQLGRDGIGYAIASQLTNQNLVRTVKLAVMHEALPDDPLYPYAQTRGYAYKQKPNATAAAFLGFAGAPRGQAAVSAAKTKEAAAVATALLPKPPVISATERFASTDKAGKRGIFFWFGWLLLPLAMLGLLLQGLLRFFRRQRPVAEAAPQSPVTDSAVLPEPTLQLPAKTDATVEKNTSSEPASDIVDAAVVEPAPELEATPTIASSPAQPAAIATAVAASNSARFYQEAIKLMGFGRYAEAIPYLDQAVVQNPEDLDAWIAQGKTLLALERSPEALNSFDRVIAINPDLAVAWRGKGDALIKLGRAAEATPCYERASALPAELPNVVVEPLAETTGEETVVTSQPEVTTTAPVSDEAVTENSGTALESATPTEGMEPGADRVELPVETSTAESASSAAEVIEPIAIASDPLAEISLGATAISETELDQATPTAEGMEPDADGIELPVETSTAESATPAAENVESGAVGAVPVAEISVVEAIITDVEIASAAIAPDVTGESAAPTRLRDSRSSTEPLAPIVLDYLASQGKTPATASDAEAYRSLAYAVHRYMQQTPIANLPEAALAQPAGRIITNLSAEYLPGPQLENALINLNIYDRVDQMVRELGFDLRRLIDQEVEPGLGRGDLGRLGICYLDSLSTIGIPAIAYGIRYGNGSFNQEIHDGWQVETADNWLHDGNPWEVQRPEKTVSVGFGGSTEAYIDDQKRFRVRWLPAEVAQGIPHDTAIPSYHTNTTNTLRLWRAEGSDYLSNILYPSDMEQQGKELRLKQQFFLASCALQDVLRSHLSTGGTVENLPERFTMQLNDTDSIIAIAELMRLLLDDHALGWEAAWAITQRTFAYTNHSLLPEAIDQHYYALPLMHGLLPRHHEIILGINCRFLNQIREQHPGDHALAERLSVIDETGEKFVRMVHLGCVGSFAVNGVSALHTDLLKHTLLPDYAQHFPDKFSNKTNGVSPRRFLLLSNRHLAELITRKIGDSWVTNLDELRRLGAFIDNAEFRSEWQQVKQSAKHNLAGLIQQRLGIEVNSNALFDIQAMDIQEYKRQHLNVLHILTLYCQIKANPSIDLPPRTFIFAGKAAPDYFMAKLMIKLIHSVAMVVNNDPDVAGRLQVVFLPDFSVKLAQQIYPAADVSEHISLAGTEACGTGSLIFGLNGAVLLATPDGVMPEIQAEVGAENMFMFGMTAPEVASLKAHGYNPWDIYHANPTLKEIIDRLNAGEFSNGDAGLFKPLTDRLFYHDPYLVLADYIAYVDRQGQIGQAFQDTDAWLRKSIYTTARMGLFSSDRAVKEYCRDIWQVELAASPRQQYA